MGLMLLLAACAKTVIVHDELADSVATPTVVKKETRRNMPSATHETAQKLQKESPTETESTQNETPGLERIDLIEIWVRSREIHVYQNLDDGTKIEQIFPAATATQEKEKELPFGKIGHVYKIGFNPSWTPTGNIRKEIQKKHPKKKIPKTYPPGKNNPLGIGKMYFIFRGGPNDLGIHDTDEQDSIGKQASHGCIRTYTEDFLDIAAIILKQNGINPDPVIARAKAHPHTSKTIYPKDCPKVVYLKK